MPDLEELCNKIADEQGIGIETTDEKPKSFSRHGEDEEIRLSYQKFVRDDINPTSEKFEKGPFGEIFYVIEEETRMQVTVSRYVGFSEVDDKSYKISLSLPSLNYMDIVARLGKENKLSSVFSKQFSERKEGERGELVWYNEYIDLSELGDVKEFIYEVFLLE